MTVGQSDSEAVRGRQGKRDSMTQRTEEKKGGR